MARAGVLPAEMAPTCDHEGELGGCLLIARTTAETPHRRWLAASANGVPAGLGNEPVSARH
jgi:hypothetical protein